MICSSYSEGSGLEQNDIELFIFESRQIRGRFLVFIMRILRVNILIF
jgi:hypothetical protein